jgi:hypothetical protein
MGGMRNTSRTRCSRTWTWKDKRVLDSAVLARRRVVPPQDRADAPGESAWCREKLFQTLACGVRCHVEVYTVGTFSPL